MLLDASRQEGFASASAALPSSISAGLPPNGAPISIGQINRLGTEYYYRLKGGKYSSPASTSSRHLPLIAATNASPIS